MYKRQPFNDALTAATNVYKDENAMQEEINTVYTELVKAFVNLRSVSYTHLWV